MKVVCLISGGKDSCFNMMHCVAMNHQIVALANLYPSEQGESDSYMYQTVGSEAIDIYSQAMQLPLFRREIQGSSKEIDLFYHENTMDEVEDLYCLLQSIKKEVPFDGVSCGAILSDYQRIRVENVCSRLGLVTLSYLWRQDQKKLLQSMIDNGLHAIIIKTAALGLVPGRHLGKSLHEIKPHLLALNSKYGSHICGEGGEYETFTLDCPLFKKRIVIDESEIVLHSDDDVMSVAYLRLKSLHLQDKAGSPFDFSVLVPNFLQSKKNNFEKVSNETIKNDLKWELSSSEVKSEELPSISIYSDQSCLCVSNLIATCQSYNTDDVEKSTKRTLHSLHEILQEYRHQFSDIVKVHIWLVDMSHFALINSVYVTYFKHNPPVRVCVTACLNESDMLGHKLLFGIDCICLRNSSAPIKTMHVQGISHWAPANIGPYSQSKLTTNHCFVAGQIGLVPGSMSLVKGGIEAEAKLSLQHVQSVLNATDPGLNLSYTLHCICYVTNDSYIQVVKSVWADEVGEDLRNNIVYVTVPSLPRDSRVEWEVVTARNVDEINRSSKIFFRNSGCFDFLGCVKALLTQCKEHSASLPSQICVFYSKRNTSVLHLQGVFKALKSNRSHLPSISWLPVQSVCNHSSSNPSSMALVCCFSNDLPDSKSQNHDEHCYVYNKSN